MATFDYRRELTARELIPAVGAGIGAGVVVAYFAQILLRRVRLPRPSAPPARPASRPRP